MTRPAPRGLAVLATVAMWAWSTAPAGALPAPSVDNTALPAPAPPRPVVPTTQRQTCSVPSRSEKNTPADNPLNVLALDALGALSQGQGQRVAVIDTGVARHPRLANLEAVGDYVGTGDGTQDCDGHGTVVAGIISAAPDSSDPTGFRGIAPGATLMSLRQSSTKFGPAADAGTTGIGDVDTMAAAVRTAADLGATVINISSVACASGGLDDRPLGAALAYAVDVKDVVVVTAAGNVGGANHCPRQGDGSDWSSTTVAVSPAWYDDLVLTVGSVDADGAPSAFTLGGPWVDVAAPGEHLLSLNPSGIGIIDSLPAASGSVPISGTSYAAPVVAGVAALVRSRFPELSARQVIQRIESTARHSAHGWEPKLGNGIVDPAAALDTDPAVTPGPEIAVPHPISTTAASSERHRTRGMALAGFAGCVALLFGGVVWARRRFRDDIADGERGGSTQHRSGW